jgi:hypothetical protein
VTGPEAERVHPAAGKGFEEAVTFAWGDPARGVYGSARIALREGRAASALGLLFEGGDVAAAAAATGEEVAGAAWEDISVDGVAATIEAPLTAWRARFEREDDGFDLRFEARAMPLELAVGGMAGYEQPCRVTGTARVQSRPITVDGLGQRGHEWGARDWQRLELARTVSAWWDDDRALALASVRPAGAEGHEDEEVEAWFVAAGEDDAPEPRRAADARLSTAYDAAGHHQRAGLELWMEGESAVPVRAAGDAVCGTSLELGGLALDAAFLRWRMGGREGVGRYDVLRRRA